MRHDYSVYILANRTRGALYVGVTNNLEGRVSEHKLKLIKGHTKKYDITRLVYYESFSDIRIAIDREKQLKRYTHEWKYNLIERDNPHWDDLARAWYGPALKPFNFLVDSQTPEQVRGDS